MKNNKRVIVVYIVDDELKELEGKDDEKYYGEWATSKEFLRYLELSENVVVRHDTLSKAISRGTKLLDKYLIFKNI